MRRLRQLHLYLGCVFAPTLVFFVISGAWQTFSWHNSKMYHVPRIVMRLSNVHLHQDFALQQTHPSIPFRWLVLAMAIGISLSAALGIVMAFKHSRQRSNVWLCLIAGFTLPVLLLFV